MQQRYQTFSREACQPSASLSLSVCVTAPALPPVSLQSAPVAVVTLIGCIPLLFQILHTHRDSVGGGGYISVSSTFNNTESYFKCIC